MNVDPRIAEIEEIKGHACVGTDGYYRVSELHPRNFVVTSGIRDWAIAAGTHWILLEIALSQKEVNKHQSLERGGRQWWKLTVNQEEGGAELICLADDGETVLVRSEFTICDYPLSEESIWVMPGQTEADGLLAVCMLPAEY